jgi:uncharacterized membrane protein YvbJ
LTHRNYRLGKKAIIASATAALLLVIVAAFITLSQNGSHESVDRSALKEQAQADLQRLANMASDTSKLDQNASQEATLLEHEVSEKLNAAQETGHSKAEIIMRARIYKTQVQAAMKAKGYKIVSND